jgi:hypothetical protein
MHVLARPSTLAGNANWRARTLYDPAGRHQNGAERQETHVPSEHVRPITDVMHAQEFMVNQSFNKIE